MRAAPSLRMSVVRPESYRHGQDIRDRTARFAQRVVALCQRLQKNGEVARVLTKQLVSCSTSVAANLEEASAGESRRDFFSKCAIALKESREAWSRLRLLRDTGIGDPGEVEALVHEANELVAILTSSIRTAKQRQATSCAEARSWRTRDGGEPGSWYLVAPSE